MLVLMGLWGESAVADREGLGDRKRSLQHPSLPDNRTDSRLFGRVAESASETQSNLGADRAPR